MCIYMCIYKQNLKKIIKKFLRGVRDSTERPKMGRLQMR